MSPLRQIHIDIRLPRWTIVVLTAAPFLMGSLGAYAVTRGGNLQLKTCESVHGLRNDLVEVVRDGDKRSRKTITDAFEGVQERRLLHNLDEQTRHTLAKISDPTCP